MLTFKRLHRDKSAESLFSKALLIIDSCRESKNMYDERKDLNILLSKGLNHNKVDLTFLPICAK